MVARILLLAAALLQVQPSAPSFDATRAWRHLEALVALGPRPAGSPALASSRRYITSQLNALGISVTEQAWDDSTPIGRLHMVNLIATIPGDAPDRIVIGGHYDTKPVREFRFVGANDGGSSAAFLIELARVLKARPHTMTIELLFLDGEEATVEWQGLDHTYGSRHYVRDAAQRGTLASLKAFILVDMIADKDLRFKRELRSTPWLTDLIWSTAARLNHGSTFVRDVTEVEDDHLPFLEARIPSVDIIDLEYDAWHTAGDTLDAISPRGLGIVGQVLLESLPALEERFRRRP